MNTPLDHELDRVRSKSKIEPKNIVRYNGQTTSYRGPCENNLSV